MPTCLMSGMKDNSAQMEDYAQIDPKLQEACQQATATNSMTPLIKQELQLTILHRRHMSGQGEVEYEAKKLPVKRELTEAELEKKRRRKEQNRRAAERCRIKKKKMSDIMNSEFIEEQKKSRQLALEVEQLKKERDMLIRLLNDHTCTAATDVTTQAHHVVNQQQYVTSPLGDVTSQPHILQEEYVPMTWSPPPQHTEETLQLQANGIKNEYQPLPACSVTSQSTTVQDLLSYDINGPFGDPFDEEIRMYPCNDEVKPEYQAISPCTDPLPDLDLLDAFVASEGMSPCSPGMMTGRVSISDYIEH